jgi:mono/diheme cytochrome c family protein
MIGLRQLGLLGLAAAISGCAANGETAPQSAAAPSAAVERGLVLANRECSRCHALGDVGDSRNMTAPPFRVLRLRHTSLSLERRLEEISKGGHYEMPPLKLQANEVSDLAAYLETVGSN